MKNKILFPVGFLLGIVSVYQALGWIYICSNSPDASYVEKQTNFYQRILFGMNPNDSGIIHFIAIFFGIVSVFIFGMLLSKLNQMTNNTGKRKVYFTLYLIVLILFALFTVMNIWFIL
ncbi:MAG: hypothetical protein R3277_05045 [Brumimicrobium sp.]|nr:hypothetical protein [Brumimicrobium sp.]